MARNDTVSASKNSVTELSDAENITGTIRIQNLGAFKIHIQATTDGTAPHYETGFGGSLVLQPGEVAQGTLANWFPGVSGGVRLWAKTWPATKISVSYA